ncbi:GNAT family N-acetyltransferase [Sphingomonas sp. ASV193]|uniref:GNAT family N-acetyltransferase n=1 Tax=Sphingomonas sp. ASV193 TaxID=3144405 RepID=UPI0032E8FF4B
MTEPLDRPIWHALKGRQAHLAVGTARALRFDPEVEPFVASADDSADALAGVAGLLKDDEDRMLFIQRGAPPLPPGTREVERGLGVQLVVDGFAPTPPPPGVIALTESDVPAMIALAALTEPGPFRKRTHTLGQFWGVKDSDGRLLAMAGERMKLAGMSEISGVCTHPGARGRGLAAMLSRHVGSEICRRGEAPFLHAWAGNEGAIRLYRRLGFRIRGEVGTLLVARA